MDEARNRPPLGGRLHPAIGLLGGDRDVQQFRKHEGQVIRGEHERAAGHQGVQVGGVEHQHVAGVRHDDLDAVDGPDPGRRVRDRAGGG